MNKFIAVAVAVLSLSGCVVNAPAPAPQVTAVASTPAPTSGEMWCTAHAEQGGKQSDLGINFVRDYGDYFTVTNRENKVIITSPKLYQKRESAIVGFNTIGLMFSKGTGKYAGYYGVFRFYDKGMDSLTFSCK